MSSRGHVFDYLKPLITFMRILGTPLAGVGQSRIKDRWLRWMGWLFFILNVTIVLVEFYAIYAKGLYQQSAFNPSSTFSSTMWMIIACSIVMRICINLSLLILSGSSTQIELIENIDLVDIPHPPIRQTSTKLFRHLILDYWLIIVVAYLLNYCLYGFSMTITATIALNQFTYIFYTAALLFYMTICMLAIELFRQLKNEIAEKLATHRQQLVSPVAMDSCLRSWKERYSQLTRLVDSINRCCGSILLSITIVFLIIIISGVFLVSVMFNNRVTSIKSRAISLFNLYHAMRCVIHLIAITYLPSKLTNEAISIATLLRQFTFSEYELHGKINFFMIEILETLPRITVYGLFHVDLSLLPKMGGAVLTYLIITVQFKMAEGTHSSF